MAKTCGNIRCSTHGGDPYHVNGIRREYKDLPPNKQRSVIALKKTYARGMIERLRDKTVKLQTDEGTIEVGFNTRGLEHVAQDAMIKLSGKYFSKNSLYHLDEILAKSTYVPTPHGLYKNRKDGTQYFFKYQDSQGRGVYFKVAYNPTAGDGKKYFLYSVSDRMD